MELKPKLYHLEYILSLSNNIAKPKSLNSDAC